MGSSYSLNDVPNLSGKVIIITGGTSGIGMRAAIELAKKGAHVIATARNERRKQEALEAMSNELGDMLPGLNIEFGIADQENLHSIRDFVTWYLQKNIPLHVLILNAGIAFVPFKLIEGIESQLFVNYVAHHYLVRLLLPKLKESAPSRVVVVSSNTFRLVHQLDLSSPTPKTYSKVDAYGNSKLAALYFAKALQKRTKDDNIYVNSLHPGTVSTPIVKKFDIPSWMMPFINVGSAVVGCSPTKGALTELYVATSPDIELQGIRGKHFYPVAKMQHCLPSYAEDEFAAEQMWTWTETKIGEIITRQSRIGLAEELLEDHKNVQPKTVASAKVPVQIGIRASNLI